MKMGLCYPPVTRPVAPSQILIASRHPMNLLWALPELPRWPITMRLPPFVTVVWSHPARSQTRSQTFKLVMSFNESTVFSVSILYPTIVLSLLSLWSTMPVGPLTPKRIMLLCQELPKNPPPRCDLERQTQQGVIVAKTVFLWLTHFPGVCVLKNGANKIHVELRQNSRTTLITFPLKLWRYEWLTTALWFWCANVWFSGTKISRQRKLRNGPWWRKKGERN